MTTSQTAPIPKLIVSPYQHVADVLRENEIDFVVSILGRRSDRLPWPDVGNRRVLRLEFDDVFHDSGKWKAPTADHVQALIDFAKLWHGSTNALIHCRAGTSRSTAGAMVLVAAIGRIDLASRVRWAKAYFQPHEGLLGLADGLLGLKPGLIDLSRELLRPERSDDWGPVAIPLN